MDHTSAGSSSAAQPCTPAPMANLHQPELPHMSENPDETQNQREDHYNTPPYV